MIGSIGSGMICCARLTTSAFRESEREEGREGESARERERARKCEYR